MYSCVVSLSFLIVSLNALHSLTLHCTFGRHVLIFTDLCSNVHCKFRARCENGACVCPTDCPLNKELVCGSNLKTYLNECELQKASCRLNRNLTVHFYGDCTEGLSPAVSFGKDRSCYQVVTCVI